MLDKAYYVCKGEHLRMGNNNEYGPFGELQIGDILNAEKMYNLIKNGHIDDRIGEDAIKERIMKNFSITKDGHFEVYLSYSRAIDSCLRACDVTIYEVVCDHAGYKTEAKSLIDGVNLHYPFYYYKEIAIINIAYRYYSGNNNIHFPVPNEEEKL